MINNNLVNFPAKALRQAPSALQEPRRRRGDRPKIPEGRVVVDWSAAGPGAGDSVTLKEVADRLHVGLGVLHLATGEALMMNRAGTVLLGRSFVPGMSFAAAFAYYRLVKEDGSPYPSAGVWERIEGRGGPFVLTDMFVLRPDGQQIPLRVSLSQAMATDGREKLLLCIFDDRSQEYRLEKAQAEFVAVASHQLRTPATGTQAFLSMLLDGDAGPLTPMQEDFLRRAYTSNGRALKLVESLLHMARIESGHFEADLRETDFGLLVKKAVNEHLATMHDDRRHKIELALPTKPAMVSIDREKVRMMLDNLIDNAKKYSPQSSTIEVFVAETPAHVIFSIYDHGLGIEEEKQYRLFRRFGRANTLTAPDVEGTGLGLYLVQKIVELHGGEVRLSSAPGQGTLVIARFPKQGAPNEQENTGRRG